MAERTGLHPGDGLQGGGRVGDLAVRTCVCTCVCARVCVHTCVCMYMHVCVCTYSVCVRSTEGLGDRSPPQHNPCPSGRSSQNLWARCPWGKGWDFGVLPRPEAGSWALASKGEGPQPLFPRTHLPGWGVGRPTSLVINLLPGGPGQTFRLGLLVSFCPNICSLWVTWSFPERLNLGWLRPTHCVPQLCRGQPEHLQCVWKHS